MAEEPIKENTITFNVINKTDTSKEAVFGGENNEEEIQEIKEETEIKPEVKLIEEIENPVKKGKFLFQKGNKYGKGRPKKTEFSLKNDLIKALKRIKHKDSAKYREIIESYWENKSMRQLLMEIIDGKARQSTELSGNLQNPIRIIEVKPMTEGENEAK